MGSGFYKLRAIRIPRRKHTASLNGHADGVRSAGELFKRVNALFIRILPQQQPDILSPCGADAFRVSLRSSQKLPGLQKRVADLVVNAGLGAQDLLFPRRILHVLPILPKSPVHGFQTKIVLFQFLFELRFLSDIRAGNLVNSFSGHSQPHALKAPRLAILQRDDGLRFNHFPENVRVEQRFSRKLMAQLVHLEVFQAGQTVFPRKAQRTGQVVAAFLDGNRRELPSALMPQRE